MQLRLCVVRARCRELDAGVGGGKELHKVWIVDIVHGIVQNKFWRKSYSIREGVEM